MPSMPSHAYHKGTREGLRYVISITHLVSDSYFVLERIIARGVIREPHRARMELFANVVYTFYASTGWSVDRRHAIGLNQCSAGQSTGEWKQYTHIYVSIVVSSMFFCNIHSVTSIFTFSHSIKRDVVKIHNQARDADYNFSQFCNLFNLRQFANISKLNLLLSPPYTFVFEVQIRIVIMRAFIFIVIESRIFTYLQLIILDVQPIGQNIRNIKYDLL